MDFRLWLEADIKFGGFFKDGTVIVYIDGKRYVYNTDALYHKQIKDIAKYRPGKALNLIKSMIKNGSAFLAT